MLFQQVFARAHCCCITAKRPHSCRPNALPTTVRRPVHAHRLPSSLATRTHEHWTNLPRTARSHRLGHSQWQRFSLRAYRQTDQSTKGSRTPVDGGVIGDCPQGKSDCESYALDHEGRRTDAPAAPVHQNRAGTVRAQTLQQRRRRTPGACLPGLRYSHKRIILKRLPAK